jgi:hypothetical protein
MTDYLKSTRHPFSSLMFILPLLIVYEGGVLLLAPQSSSLELRNGADAWVRTQLVAAGVNFAWTLPILLVAFLCGATAWDWKERPKKQFTAFFGMILESLVFAVGLWALSRNFLPLLDRVGVPTHSIGFQTPATGQVVRYIGAGIYEEVLFRLAIFGVLSLLLQVILIPKYVAIPIAAVAGALAFSAAHHLGTNGEAITTPVFLFRAVAGLIFTILYAGRGLGIAVGAHAGYNILVGVSVG